MGALPFQSIEVRKFGGGITDDYIDCEPSQFQRADNLLLDDQEKLFSIPGSVLYDVSNARPGTGSQRIGLLYNYFDNTDIFAVSGKSLFYYRSGWQEINGPTGNPAIPSGLNVSFYSVTEFQKHIFITNDSSARPVVIYPTETGYFLRTAGLPTIADTKNYNPTNVLNDALALANDLRSRMSAHFNYSFGDYHVAPDTISDNLITHSAATNEDTLYLLIGDLIKAFNSHTGDILKAYPDYHRVPGLGAANLFKFPDSDLYYKAPNELSNNLVPDNLIDAVNILNELKLSWNTHDSEIFGSVSPATGGTTSFHQNFGSPEGGLYQVASNYIDSISEGVEIVNDLSAVVKWVVRLKTILYGHITNADTIWSSATPHGTRTDPNNIWLDPGIFPYMALTPTTLRDLITYTNNLIAAYSDHVEGLNSGTVHALGAGTYPSSNTTLDSSGLAGTSSLSVTGKFGWVSCFLAANDTLSQVVKKVNDIYTKLAAHYIDTSGGIGIHSGAGPFSISYDTFSVGAYSYQFHYFYEYTVDGLTYEIRGPVTTRSDLDITLPEKQAILLRNIPILSNSIDDNYDTVNIKIKIYRTTNAGSTYYHIATIDNGTTSYSDSFSDADISENETIYTTGGEVEAVQPQIAKFVHAVDEVVYYGCVEEGSYRILQSVPGKPEAVPGSFFIDLPEEVTGISSFKGVPIAFTRSGVYRLEGQFDFLGRGAIRAVSIGDSGGCIAPYTPVQTIEGVFFFGKDGVHVTDGYTVKNVTKEWKTTYLSLTTTDIQRERSYGVYDPRQGRVWFGRVSSGDECDGFHVMDLNWGVLGDKAFTTASGGNNFAPTAACFFRDQLIRGDSRGYIFKHDPNYGTHPKIDESTDPSLWSTKTIIWDHISRTFDWGNLSQRKYAGRFNIKARNVGNVSIQVRSIDDLGSRTKDYVPIRYRGDCVWGDTTQVWGSSTAVWGAIGDIDEKRRPPANSLRFSDKQLQFTNAYVVIQNSDTLGTAVVDGGLLTATIGSNWNLDLVDQYIYFDVDNYSTGYPITAVSGAILTLSSAPASGTYQWVVKGYPKGERLSLLSYQIQAALTGWTQSDAANELGNNAS